MYLMFDSKDNAYSLKNEGADLEKILMEAIRNNPAKYLGKGETKNNPYSPCIITIM